MCEVFRLAENKDFDTILSIFLRAIENMNSKGICQWDEIYPDKTVLINDIVKKQMYLQFYYDNIVSAVVLNNEQDKLYETANWEHTDAKFAVIHRLCVDPGVQNMGFGTKTVLHSENFLRERGYVSIRLDAFSENPYSLRMYENLGYKKIGEVNFRKGLFYLYEKRLSEYI